MGESFFEEVDPEFDIEVFSFEVVDVLTGLVVFVGSGLEEKSLVRDGMGGNEKSTYFFLVSEC